MSETESPALHGRDRATIERWFIRRGVPAVSPFPRSRGELWRRAIPALLANLLFWLLVAVSNLPDKAWILVPAFAAMVLVPWVIRNLVGRRHPFAVPRQIAMAELLVVLVGPPGLLVAAGTFNGFSESGAGGQPIEGYHIALFIVATGFQLIYLVAVRILVGLGIAAMMVWFLRELANSVVAFYGALSRTLPMLLGVVTFFFFTAEVWQSIGRLHFLNYSMLLALFTILGAMFVRKQQRPLSELARFDTAEDFAEATPEGLPLQAPAADRFPLACPLDVGARLELRLVAILGRLVVSVVVALGISLVFFVIGVVAIDSAVVKAWIAAAPSRIFAIRVPGGEWLLTWEHLKVTGFLATFSGFYFLVVSSTDPALREGISDTAEDAVREACAVRAMALDAVGELPG